MKRTPNYGLPIIENNDRYSKEEQNNAMSIIDNELYSVSEAIKSLEPNVGLDNDVNTTLVNEIIEARNGEKTLNDRLNIYDNKFNLSDERLKKFSYLASDFNIIGDGSDESDKIINMFNSIPDGSTIKFEKTNKFYGLTKGINLLARNNLTIESNGATIKFLDGVDDVFMNNFPHVFANDSIFKLFNCNCIKINNLTLDGNILNRIPFSEHESQNSNIFLMSSHNVTITNCNLINGMTDGICLFRSESSENNKSNKNIVIDNCYFDSNRRNNISIIDGNNVKLVNCELINAGKIKGTLPMGNICIESDNAYLKYPVKDVFIDNCICENAIKYNIFVSGVGGKNINISNVVCENSEIGVYVGSYSQYPEWIENMECKIDNVNINGASIGIHTIAKTLKSLTNCIIKNCSTIGILGDLNDGLKINNVKVFENGAGVRLRDCKHVMISDCLIYNNANIESVSNAGNYGLRIEPTNEKSIVKLSNNFIYNDKDRVYKQFGLNVTKDCISRADNNTFNHINGGAFYGVKGFGNVILDLDETWNMMTPSMNFSDDTGGGLLRIGNKKHHYSTTTPDLNKYQDGDIIYCSNPTNIFAWIKSQGKLKYVLLQED